jgi:hypothetical protein
MLYCLLVLHVTVPSWWAFTMQWLPTFFSFEDSVKVQTQIKHFAVDNHLVCQWSFTEWMAWKRIAKPRRQAFDSVVILVVRSIWLECNDQVFSRGLSSPGALGRKIMLACEDWCRARLLNRWALARE